MTSSTGCYGDHSRDNSTNSSAVNEPSNLEYCDPDADGFGAFNLTDANTEISNGLKT